MVGRSERIFSGRGKGLLLFNYDLAKVNRTLEIFLNCSHTRYFFPQTHFSSNQRGGHFLIMANGSGGGKIEGNKEMSRTENPRFGSNRGFFPFLKKRRRDETDPNQNKTKRNEEKTTFRSKTKPRRAFRERDNVFRCKKTGIGSMTTFSTFPPPIRSRDHFWIHIKRKNLPPPIIR